MQLGLDLDVLDGNSLVAKRARSAGQDALSGSPSARNFDYAKPQGAIIPYPQQVSPPCTTYPLLEIPKSPGLKRRKEQFPKLRMFHLRVIAKREISG